jgi:ATP-dependent RNA helicase DHX8/PRP22
VIIIAAMLSSQNCFCRPKKKRLQADAKKAQFISDRGDHLTLLRVFNAFTKCSSKFLDFLKITLN